MLIILLLILFGCGKTEIGGDRTLRLGGLGGKPGPINQIISNGTISVNLADLVFSPLVRINSRMLPEPALAERWEVSPDGLTYTFYLRNGIKFHDGTEFTAADCAFTYNAVLNPATNSPWRENYNMIKTVSAENNYTFKVTLKEPQASFINLMNFPIHSGIRGHNQNIVSPDSCIGTGPFRFKEWVTTPQPSGPTPPDCFGVRRELANSPLTKGDKGGCNESIILEANPDYYEGKPQIDRIIATGYDTFPEYFSGFMKGQIDMIQFLNTEQYQTIARDPGFRAYSFPSIYTYMIDYNPGHPIFKDQRVRQAMAYAINIPEIINKVEGISYSPLWRPRRSGVNSAPCLSRRMAGASLAPEKGAGGLSSPEDGNNNPLNPPLPVPGSRSENPSGFVELRGNIYQSTGPFLPGAWFSCPVRSEHSQRNNPLNESDTSLLDASNGADPAIKPLEYNPAEALKLLKEAGWEMGNDGILQQSLHSPLEKGGGGLLQPPLSPFVKGESIQKFRFTLLVDPKERITEQIARIIYQDLYKIGVRMEIKTYDHLNQDKELVGSAGAAIISFRILANLEPSWHSDKQQRIGTLWKHDNPEIDALFEKANTTQDLKERTKLYHQLHRLVYQDQSGTFLYNHPNLCAIRARFGNTEEFFSPAMPFYTIKDWKIR